MEILSEKKKEKFGNEDDVPVDEAQWKTWKTDPADAPRDLAGDFDGFYNADVDSTQEMPSVSGLIIADNLELRKLPGSPIMNYNFWCALYGIWPILFSSIVTCTTANSR